MSAGSLVNSLSHSTIRWGSFHLRFKFEPLQASDIHFHSIIKCEDGGGTGCGWALLQVRDALVEILAWQQKCFGWQVLHLGRMLGRGRWRRRLVLWLLWLSLLGPEGGTGIGGRPVSFPSSTSSANLCSFIRHVALLRTNGFIAVLFHWARGHPWAFCLLWCPCLWLHHHIKATITFTSGQGPIATNIPRTCRWARHASFLLAWFADFRVHIWDLKNNTVDMRWRWSNKCILPILTDWKLLVKKRLNTETLTYPSCHVFSHVRAQRAYMLGLEHDVIIFGRLPYILLSISNKHCLLIRY